MLPGSTPLRRNYSFSGETTALLQANCWLRSSEYQTSLGGAAFEAEEEDENGFFSDGDDDADLFADDDLFGEDWNQ